MDCGVGGPIVQPVMGMPYLGGSTPCGIHGSCLEGGGKQGQKQSRSSFKGIESRFDEQFRMAMRSERSIKMFAKRVTGEFGAIARAGIAALMLVAGIGLVAAPAMAADAKKAAANKEKNYWVKLCDKAHSAKDPKKEINVCVTHHEQIHTKTGMVLVSVALRQIEGQKDVVMVCCGGSFTLR